MTAEIRQQLVGHNDYSIDAESVMTSTACGTVFLCGPVTTQLEEDYSRRGHE